MAVCKIWDCSRETAQETALSKSNGVHSSITASHFLCSNHTKKKRKKRNEVEKWHIVCEVSWTPDRVEVIAWSPVSTEFELKKFTSAIKKPKYWQLCLTIRHNIEKHKNRQLILTIKSVIVTTPLMIPVGKSQSIINKLWCWLRTTTPPQQIITLNEFMIHLTIIL